MFPDGEGAYLEVPVRSILLLVISFSALPQNSFANIATTEQKIIAAKSKISQAVQAEGYRLVEGSLDLYASNDVLAAYKAIPDLAYSIYNLDISGRYSEVQYAKFIVVDAKGKKMAGWVYVTATKIATATPLYEKAVVVKNPFTDRYSEVQISRDLWHPTSLYGGEGLHLTEM